MRKTVLVILVVVSVGAVPSFSQGRILLLAREGKSWSLEEALSDEIAVILEVARGRGYEASIATLSGQDLVGEELHFATALKVGDVDLGSFAGVIVPCMSFEPSGGPANQEYIELLRRANELGLVIAAQHSGVLLLQRAGLLKGRKYAFPTAKIAEGTYEGRGVARDGLIITSAICGYQASERKGENGSPAMTVALIEAIEETR